MKREHQLRALVTLGLMTRIQCIAVILLAGLSGPADRPEEQASLKHFVQIQFGPRDMTASSVSLLSKSA